MAAASEVPKEAKPLPPIIKKMIAMVWKEVEPRVDVLFATVLTKLSTAYADAKAKFEVYLVTKGA